jgi:hypothetical protein
VLRVGVGGFLGCTPPGQPTVRVVPPVEREGEEGGAGDGHEDDDGKDDAVHRIAPLIAPTVAVTGRMTLGRPAHKGVDGQVPRTSQAGLVVTQLNSSVGGGTPSFGTPVRASYVCPTCGALVATSAQERHEAWHLKIGG